MQYKTYTPCSLLSPYIKCYWSLQNFVTTELHAKEKIFPDGCIELIFHFGDPVKKYEKDNHAYIQPRSFIHGQLKEYMEIESTGTTGIFSIRFHPNGLRPFVSFDVQEITSQNVSVKDIWKNEGDILEEKILIASNDEQRIQIIESFLLQKLKQHISTADPAINYCVQYILQNHGNINVPVLASAVNISPRQLERRFIAAVGISMMTLARIQRFQHTLYLLEKNQYTSFTALTYELGFYDQAHFIKDFKVFTGLSPKQYLSENLSLAKNFYAE